MVILAVMVGPVDTLSVVATIPLITRYAFSPIDASCEGLYRAGAAMPKHHAGTLSDVFSWQYRSS